MSVQMILGEKKPSNMPQLLWNNLMCVYFLMQLYKRKQGEKSLWNEASQTEEQWSAIVMADILS